MWNNDDFSPETVDEQIERLTQGRSDQHLNAALTQELKAMCEEDRVILEHVRARYSAHINTRSAPDGQPVPGSPSSSWSNAGGVSAVSTQQMARPQRRSRRVFTLVAAVLVAAVLVGSVLWVGRALYQSNGLVAHPTVTPQLTGTHTSTPTAVLPTLTPSGRANAQLVYDDATNALLLFSGQDYTGGAPLIDTWTWNGLTWTPLHPAHSPDARTNATIAYDPATRQVVLFGGMREDNTGGTPVLGDTWIWNGSDWTQQHPASSPSARWNASLAYDDASGQLVLFGGTHNIGFNAPDLNDTWIWTGSNWQQQHPAIVPTARTRPGLAYDATSGQLVLFGGNAASDYGLALNDTWIWTGSNWQQQHPRTAPALSATLQGQTVTFAYPSMVYNPATGKLMLTLMGQGANDGTRPDYFTQAEWTWDGRTWTEVTMTGPAVDEGRLFYDTHLKTIFELTSFIPRTSPEVENKLWKWTGQMWAMVESW